MMCLPRFTPTTVPMTSMCPVADCLGHASVCARAGDAANAPARKTTTAEPARPMLMGASVSCGLIARAESEDQGRADGGLGSGAKAVAGGAKAEAPRVGRGLLVSTVHAGTAGAVRPSPVLGREGWRLVPRAAKEADDAFQDCHRCAARRGGGHRCRRDALDAEG